MMAVFDQRGQKVGLQYNIAGNLNFADARNKDEVLNELKKLKSEIIKMFQNGKLDEGIATVVESNVKDALQQANNPQPSKGNIINHLEKAKTIIGSVKDVSGLVSTLAEAVDKVREIF